MDALEFLNEWKRLCYSFKNCTGCPLYGLSCSALPNFRSKEEDENIVQGVEQWSNDHPTKTRQSEFLKMFPTSLLDDNGVLCVQPCQIDESVKANNKGYCPFTRCSLCREKYWLQEVE